MSGDLISRKALLVAYKVSKTIRTYDRDVARLINNAPPVVQGEPVAWLRYRDGEIDWSEDCLGASKGESLSCYDDDEYTEKPLYTTPPQTQTVKDALEKAIAIVWRELDNPELSGHGYCNNIEAQIRALIK